MSSGSLLARRPIYAGRLYPAEKEFLGTVVTRYLGAGPKLKVEKTHPKVVIAPHAGYIYSGTVMGAALSGWKKLSKVERIVILAPSHHYDFPGAALPDSGIYETPLGELPVDIGFSEHLLRHRFVHVFEAPHQNDSAIEVLLPFLQVLFGEIPIVPVVVGRADTSMVCRLLEDLWGGDETRLLLTTDLSQHQDFSSALRMDRETTNMIAELSSEKITSDQACGWRILRGFAKEGQRRRLKGRCVLATNSAETADATEEITGFGAFHFFEPNA